jgi:hypothetical protein
MYEDGNRRRAATGRPLPVVPIVPVAALDSVPPGPALAELLAAVDPDSASDGELVDVVAGWERIKCWAEAAQAAALAAFASRRPDADGGVGVSEFAADEIAPALSTARGTAEARIGFALALAGLPATHTALSAGRIGLGVAHRIVDGLALLRPDRAADAEAAVLVDAVGRTPAQVAARVARTVAALDPDAAAVRHRAAVEARRITCTPQPDGMAGIWALLRADDAALVMSTLRGQAREARTPGDGRTTEQRLADAFVDLHTAHLRQPHSPDDTARRAAGPAAGPAVRVVVAATTLLGLDQEPGELAGYGPIPALLARAIAADPSATWQRLLTDPATGALLDVGRTRYRPPAALADHVRARDRTCRFPGCRQPAQRCDLDHVRAWPDGPTSHCNLAAECRHHHRLKHETDWQVDNDADDPATLYWTSPTGHTYATRPRAPLAPT